jgi:hypothetical protein
VSEHKERVTEGLTVVLVAVSAIDGVEVKDKAGGSTFEEEPVTMDEADL